MSRHRLNILRSRVAHSVIGSATEGEGTLVGEAVRASIEAFVQCQGNIHQAVTQVAPLLHEVGVREARRHPDATRLEQSFHMAHVTVQRGLSVVVGDLVTRDVLTRLREDLMAYLVELHKVSQRGFEHAVRIHAMTQGQRIDALRACAFDGRAVADLDEMITTAGFDPAQRLVPIVSVEAALPAAILDHPESIASTSTDEVLVPEHWDLDTLGEQLDGQVVLGPAAPLATSHEGIALARSAAALLRDGSVSDPRAVVPSTDLLGELLVRGNRLLADLLIDKHLWPLENLPTRRRLVLAEMLLVSLERGVPLNRVARELGIAAQTAHNRMKSLRALLGDKLDDADQRLELIVAVRAALSRWKKS